MTLAQLLPLSLAFAGSEMDGMAAPPCGATEKDWTLEIESGDLWTKVLPNTNIGVFTVDNTDHYYNIVPIHVTASLRLDDVSGDQFLGGLLRGYTEFYFSGEYNQIVHSPKNENQYGDVMFGPRYNFVQPGWVIVPYFEVGVGFALANGNREEIHHNTPEGGGLGQDFNFSFDIAFGAKYNITKDIFVRLGAEWNHVSNAGLSEPQFANNAIDAFGPAASLGYSF